MSRSSVRTGTHGRYRAARRASPALIVFVSLMVVLLGIGPAAAYWTPSGSMSTTTGTIAAPVQVTVPATAATDVPVSWTPGSGGVAPTGYYVTRRTGVTSVAACASSPASLIGNTNCTDTAVPDGDYSYTVTAVYRSWTARSIASAVVTVVHLSGLTFTGQPTDTLAGGTIAPPVTVALLTAEGTAYPSPGIQVTLAIGTNPAGGVLAGTTSVTTDANGVATFADLSIDALGAGYTLTATSPGLTSATSSPFTVTGSPIREIPPPLLGDASQYSVLSRTAVVNTGETSVSGDLGLSPGTSITGFPPGVVGGDIHFGDAAAAAAQASLASAYAELAGRTADEQVTGELGGLILTPGVYHAVAALAVTGTLTLDAEGDPDAVFVFQTDAAFNTAAASIVNLVNGAQATNVFWVVTGAAGTGANSFLAGAILAQGAITLGASTQLIGQALSRD
ncbi:MAG: ice-binding family protein, partial [Kibdelosporangium sp.]